MYNFIIVVTFFSLWLAVFFEDALQNIFAFTLILSVGMLHGANDLTLMGQNRDQMRSWSTFRSFLAYMAIVSVGALLFYFVPTIALISFLLFSGYHFGEQHWHDKLSEDRLIAKLFFTAYGLTILFLLFYCNMEDVQEIVRQITNIWIGRSVFTWTLLAIFAMTVVTGGCLYFQNRFTAVNWICELFYLVVFFVIFQTASLIWAFAIYFIWWHSVPSIMEQVAYMYKKVTLKNFWRYCRASFPFWLLSVISLLVVYKVFGNSPKLFLSIFFSFLAAITFPHILVMTRIKKKEKGTPR